MLRKSFKSSKCKTALKLASTRIKLLKNKWEAQLKQHKKELALLLQSGQEQTARIRVEHVVREEKLLMVYGLVEIYCELIASRMAIVESQKTCPIDLKEAVASVIFASPRCADILELKDAIKHLTAKYGKDFATAAVELRPNCGVSRQLVEKLCPIALDGPTKIRILGAIAKEHNVKWDPESFGEKDMKPAVDLLNGPNTFNQSSWMHVETPSFTKPDVAVESSGSGLKSSFRSSSIHYADSGSNQSIQDTSNLGNSTRRTEVRPSYNGDVSASFSSKHNWNMEFTNATAAAQAAAESAERASIAARAAAALSNQEWLSRQNSAVSWKTSSFGSRCEGLQYDSGSNFQGESIVKNSSINILPRTNSRIRLAETTISEDEVARLAQRFNILKSTHMSGELEADTVRKAQDRMNFEHVGHLEEMGMGRQCSKRNVPSHSLPQIFSNGPNIASNFNQKQSSGEAFDNTFIIEEEKSYNYSGKTNLHDDFCPVFDDSGSDDDQFKFNAEEQRNVQASNSCVWSESSMSSSHSLLNANTLSSRQRMKGSQRKLDPKSSEFFHDRESNMVGSWHDELPVAFDNSDGPGSESEEDSGYSPYQLRTKHSLTEKETAVSNRKHKFSSVKRQVEKHQSRDFDNPSEIVKRSSSENAIELNFGMLTGGLRNKGYLRHPPQGRNKLESSSLSKDTVEGTSDRVQQSKVHKNQTSTNLESDTTDSDKDIPKKTSSSSQEPSQEKQGIKVNKSTFGFFSDTEDELPRQTSANRSGRDVYRRTKSLASNLVRTAPPSTESKTRESQEDRTKSSQEHLFNSGRIRAPGSSEGSVNSSLHGKAPSRSNSINGASHVHPKLPDYDGLAAHLLSLRHNRQ